MELEWRNIDGFPGYWVCEDGRVMGKEGIMKSHVHHSNAKDYLRISFLNGNKHRKKMVHILVAEAFVPNPYHLPEVNHKDGNTLNPHKDNLEWSTRSYQEKYKGWLRERAREEAEKQRMLENA